MAMTPAEILQRAVARSANEFNYINTLNVADRVAIDFVWFPGESRMRHSWINAFVLDHPTTGRRREIFYRWTLHGAAPVRRVMNEGRITISLPRGQRGVLKVFGTEWEIRRAPAGAGGNMRPLNQMRGIQQRLNRLGYHLRRPGRANPGVDNTHGRRTEHAILQFQCDYRPIAGAAPAASNRLRMRGEWAQNTTAQYTGNLTAYGRPVANPNPSTADSAALRAALRAVVGS